MSFQDKSVRRIPPSVPHYYGDVVRVLMICGAASMLIGLPLSHISLIGAFPAIVGAAIVFVAFAALTNPFTSWIIIPSKYE